MDITAIRPAAPIVRVADYIDARLSAITLTDELSVAVNFGGFNENIHATLRPLLTQPRQTTTTLASLTVTANDPNAAIVVKNG